MIEAPEILSRCAAPTSTDWGSLWRDVDGHCLSDDDCPLGQWCDTSFVVPDTGEYTWRYDGSSKTGASLCVPEEGKVMLVVPANDGDSHVQLYVDEPLPYGRPGDGRGDHRAGHDPLGSRPRLVRGPPGQAVVARRSRVSARV